MSDETKIELPPLHELQRFVTRRIARSQIKNAAYNPRKISDDAREKLQEILMNFGLVESLVWNERTGNLVGGHQRLSILDALADGVDYSLDVSVVDLDEPEEKALNVALNATKAQGVYDDKALKTLLDEIEDTIDFDLRALVSETQKSVDALLNEPGCAADEEQEAQEQSMTLLFLNKDDAAITLQAIEKAKAEFSLEGKKIDAVAIAAICRNYLDQ